LGLPGSITALERPVGLPPSLLKKAEEVFVEGGLQKLQYLIAEIKHHSQNNANLLDQVRITRSCSHAFPSDRLSQALDLLDQEAAEEEQTLERHPELLGKAESSAVANRQWLEQADHYRNLLKRVRKSDEEVRSKWDQWAPLVNILAGGEVSHNSLARDYR
jgi:programmed cell death 6-interacting protein